MKPRSGNTPEKRGRRRPNVWVICHCGSFSVIEERRSTPLLPPVTQRTAITIARLIARANQSELIVQGRHGRIEFRDSHGRDPLPPRG